MKKILILLILMSGYVMANENATTTNQQLNNQQEQNYIMFLEQIQSLYTKRVIILPPEKDCDENNTNNGRLGEEEGTGGHCRP